MKIRTMALATVLGLGAASFGTQLYAQPLYDTVHVNLPYTVTIGHKTLTPGEYTIQQLRSDGSKILLFYNQDGMKFQTMAMTISALRTKTPEDTTVTLHHIGDAYYMDKIFIQGKDYGYEFPLPRRVRDREKEMAAVNVQATSTTTNVATDSSTDVQTVNADDDDDKTMTDAAPVTIPQPTPVVTPDPTPVVVPEPAPVVDMTPAPTPVVTSDTTGSSANRERRSNDDTDSMPKTSAGWLTLLLSGGTLSGAGMMLRRKR